MKNVVLKLNKRSVPNKIEFAGIVVLQMSDNPYFPTPTPALEDIIAAKAALETAYKKAQVGGPKDTEEMYAQTHALDQLLTAEGNYVEFIANKNPEFAETIILSAGMEVKTQSNKNIALLSVDKGSLANSVKLRRKAGGTGVAYKWQYSIDPFSEATWKYAGDSTVATFEINGLEPLKRYWFRVAIIKGSVQDEFSDPVTFVIS